MSRVGSTRIPDDTFYVSFVCLSCIQSESKPWKKLELVLAGFVTRNLDS